MLKALGTKLILRPVPASQVSPGGLTLVHLEKDPVVDHRYYVVSAGPKVTIQGLRHGGKVLVGHCSGQAFDFEGHPLRVIDQDDVLMVLP